MSNVQVSKLQTLTGHQDCVYTLAKSNEPHRFFSAAGDGMVVMWDLKNTETAELIAKLPNSIYALHYHSENDLLIAGHNYEGIHLLDWKNKKEIASVQLTKAAIFDIQSYNDYLFVATGEGVVMKVDLKRLNVTQQTSPLEKSARCIALHRKRKEIAVGYSDNSIRIFDFENMKLKKEWAAHTNSVFTIRYSPDGNFLFSGSRDARIKVWDVKADYIQVTEIVAHLFAINHLDFSPDGKHFVTCSMDKSIKVWSTEELKLLKVIDKSRHAGHGTSVNKVLWTSFQNQLLSASDDRTISTWNIIF